MVSSLQKLNFGCGSVQPDGWVNVDSDFSFSPDDPKKLKWFFSETKTEFAANYFDIMVAHCSLQMVEYHKLVDQLKELHRILKPGGVLRISLPDIYEAFIHYSQNDIKWFPNGEANLDDRFSAWLTWYSTTKTLLTQQALINKLREAGFSQSMICGYKVSASGKEGITDLDTRENECYFIEAIK